MIHKIAVVLTLFSSLLFPWVVTAILALCTAMFEPLLPLAAGVFIDTLYYTHGIPLGTTLGALVTALALFVRRRLKTGSIEG